MMQAQTTLFSEGDLQAMLRGKNAVAEGKVDSIPGDHVLNTPIEAIVEHIADQICVEPLIIYKDKMVHDREEIKIDIQNRPGYFVPREGPYFVPGIRLTISLPFSGDAGLWQLHPNIYTSILPYGIVRKGFGENGCLDMIFEQTSNEPFEQFERDLNQNLEMIDKYLIYHKEIIDQFNRDIPQTIRLLVEARRKRLHDQNNLGKLLKIPLRHNPSAPKIQSIQIQKRIAKPLPSPPPNSNCKPEWGIEERDYDDILTIIRHEGRTFEVAPKTFAVHGEEGLRDIILAHLNGHYKGDASGETFRRSGKTDIRIEAKDRAAFVAECKIWKGPKTVSDSIDQLLSYLTWRDCKTSIILFNKDIAGFIDILQKTRTAIESHSCFIRISKIEQGEWRCIFKSKEDDARLLQIHIFHFNLYVNADSK